MSVSSADMHLQQVIHHHRQCKVDEASQQRIARSRRERHDIMLSDEVDQRESPESCRYLLEHDQWPHPLDQVSPSQATVCN